MVLGIQEKDSTFRVKWQVDSQVAKHKLLVRGNLNTKSQRHEGHKEL